MQDLSAATMRRNCPVSKTFWPNDSGVVEVTHAVVSVSNYTDRGCWLWECKCASRVLCFNISTYIPNVKTNCSFIAIERHVFSRLLDWAFSFAICPVSLSCADMLVTWSEELELSWLAVEDVASIVAVFGTVWKRISFNCNAICWV